MDRNRKTQKGAEESSSLSFCPFQFWQILVGRAGSTLAQLDLADT